LKEVFLKTFSLLMEQTDKNKTNVVSLLPLLAA